MLYEGINLSKSVVVTYFRSVLLRRFNLMGQREERIEPSGTLLGQKVHA